MPKLIRKLSETEARNAKPKDKPYKLYDEDGLRLLVRPSGAKVWQYPYLFRGKHNTYTIGQYSYKTRDGYVGMSDARKLRDEVKDMLLKGTDPNKHKKKNNPKSEERRKTTFEAIAREWHSKGVWVPKHAQNILRTLENDVFPLIGDIQITEVTARDIIDVLTPVEERGALDVAKRLCQRCEAIIDYAIYKGICVNNPALGRSKYLKTRKTQHRPFLKESELPVFLMKLDDYTGHDYVRLGLKLLAHTFVRPGELRNARWEEFNLEESTWFIPAERMKMSRDHSVPLSRQAIKIIEELKAITGNGEFLFPSVRSAHKPITDVTLTKALRIMGYKSEQVTPHGFRHTASTILNEHGFNFDHIERQLAHVDKNKVRGTYNHAQYLDERANMMQWYSDHIGNIGNAAVIVSYKGGAIHQ
jgi:integrase